MIHLNASLRRIVYVLSFETLAIGLSTLLLGALGHGSPAENLPVATAVSVIALIWNFIFNTGFEAYERRKGLTSRSVGLRLAHSLGFEGGLVVFCVPLFMLWYGVGPIEAIKMEAAILIFFFVFTFVFTWVFDRIFSLPNAPARPA